MERSAAARSVLNACCIFLAGFVALISFANRCLAERATDTFQVNQVLSDGKSSGQFRNWSQSISERPVESVTITLRREAGSGDTFANLRYGDGPSFEGGRRVQVDNPNLHSVSWNVGGEAPRGRPLVLNVYNGNVFVQSVAVRFADAAAGRSRSNGSPPFYPEAFHPQGEERSRRDGDAREYRREGDDRRYDDRRDDGRRADDRESYRYRPREGDGREHYRDEREDGGDVPGDCRNARNLRRPRIEIAEVEPTGGLFSGKFKVSGAILGSCIEEAGYFEEGRLKEQIDFPLDNRFQRREFEIRGRSGRRGEIRAYTSDGRDEVVPVDDRAGGERERGNTPLDYLDPRPER